MKYLFLMPERSIQQLIAENFANAEKGDWQRVAKKELGEQKELASLSWDVDSLHFSPYYDKSDVSSLEYLKDYQNVLSHGANQHAPGWENIPGIKVASEKDANILALQFLQNGADGILFDVSTSNVLNVETLLKNIHWEMCSLCFFISDTKMATDILAYAHQKGYSVEKIRGTIYYTGPANSYGEYSKQVSHHFNFGIVIPQSSPVEEISQALSQAIAYMDTLDNEEMASIIFRRISVFIYCDSNFLVTIGKLKALRLLWSHLARAFNIIDYKPSDVHLHVHATRFVDKKFEPHANMISTTIDALAGICGGANALTLVTGDNIAGMANRIAVNVSHILKEESHLDKVYDPLAGAYAVDRMVHELATAAWKDFQEKNHEA